jgi:hypothetical protein
MIAPSALHGNADLSRHGFPAHGDLDWYQPATGWIVISLTQWAFGTNPSPFDGYAWLKAFEPVATIGKTVPLYYVDPAHNPARVSSTDPAGSRPSTGESDANLTASSPLAEAAYGEHREAGDS